MFDRFSNSLAMTPGVYQMSFRGLTLREAWRFSRSPFKFLLALGLKAAAQPGSRCWLPPQECEAPCTEAELSDLARAHLLPAVAEARAMGYTTGNFTRLVRNHDPNTAEGFSHLALHEDHQRMLYLGFIVNTATGAPVPGVSASGGLASDRYDAIEFPNHFNHLDSGPRVRKVQVAGPGLGAIDAAMQHHLAAHPREVFRTFSGFSEMKAHTVSVDNLAFETRIARGLFRHVGSE